MTPDACPTVELLEARGPVHFQPIAGMLPEKITRDAAGPYDHVIETADFAIKWGHSAAFDVDDATAMADAFETAWAYEVNRLGFDAPAGTEMYRFNVYVGDTGQGTPPSIGAAYYLTDPEDQPMIVVAPATVADRDLAASTAAHEFFHALQDATGNYVPGGPGTWYWEAGAMWMEGQVRPDDPHYATFLHGLAFRPELPLGFYAPPDGSVEGYHAYGAFLFLRHLSEVTADEGLVVRSWRNATPDADPLVVLDGLLVPNTLEQVFFDFAARSATFDYEDEAVYEAAIEAHGGFDSLDSHRPTGTIFGDTLPMPPAADPPQSFGANDWWLRLSSGAATIDFEGDPDVDWGVTVAVQHGDEHVRTPMDVRDGSGTVEVNDLFGAADAEIAVAAVGRDGAVGPFDYTLQVGPPALGDTDEARHCGCANAPRGAWWVALSAASVRRRSRSRSGSRLPRPA